MKYNPQAQESDQLNNYITQVQEQLLFSCETQQVVAFKQLADGTIQRGDGRTNPIS